MLVMKALTYARIQPWQLAGIYEVAASMTAGFASIEVRRSPQSPWDAMAAAVFADLVSLLAMPSLSPALVTTISGLGMIVIVWLGSVDKPPPMIKIAACCISLSVVVVAIDLHLSGRSVPTIPTSTQQAAFWATMGVAAVITASAAANRPMRWQKVCLLWERACRRPQPALVYVIMNGGAVGFFSARGFSYFRPVHFKRVTFGKRNPQTSANRVCRVSIRSGFLHRQFLQ